MPRLLSKTITHVLAGAVVAGCAFFAQPAKDAGAAEIKWYGQAAFRIKTSGGKVILITDAAGAKEASDGVWKVITLPTADPVFAAPILHALPVQLLAYHTAIAKGTDVDQPRNLAKSVTVE